MEDLKELMGSIDPEKIMKAMYAMKLEEKGLAKGFEEAIKHIDEVPRNEVFDEEDSDEFALRQEISAKIDHISWTLMYKDFDKEEKESKEVSKLIVKELRSCADKLENFYSSEE